MQYKSKKTFSYNVLFLTVLPATKIPVPARAEKIDKKIAEKISERIDDGESKLSSLTSSSSSSSQPSRRLITVDFSLFKVICDLSIFQFTLYEGLNFLYIKTFPWFIYIVVRKLIRHNFENCGISLCLGGQNFRIYFICVLFISFRYIVALPWIYAWKSSTEIYRVT